MAWFTEVLALAALTTGLVLGLEVAVRAWRRWRHGTAWWAPYEVKVPRLLYFAKHPYALYVKKPGNGGYFPSNSRGYAGTREHAVTRRPGSVRIMVISNSTAEAYDPAQGPESTWPAKLEAELRRRLPEADVEVINNSSSGYTTVESLIEFALRGIELRPDIVLIYHNVADAWTCQMVEGFQPDYSHARCQRPWRIHWVHRLPIWPDWAGYQAARTWLAWRLDPKANALLHWIAQPPWKTVRRFNPEAVAVFKRNVRHLACLAKANGAAPILIKWECDWAARRVPVFLESTPETTAVYFEFLAANNRALAELAAEIPGCASLDVGPFAPEDFVDAVHFSGPGLERMARRVADAVEPHVRRIMAGSVESGAPRAEDPQRCAAALREAM